MLICSSGRYSHMDNLTRPMKTMAWLVITLTLIVAMCPFKVNAQCTTLDDCRCKLPNGKIIDISSIGNKDGSSPKYDYSLPDDGQSLYYEYSFNGCYAYSDKYCSGAVACQKGVNDDTGPGFPLGTPGNADYTDGTYLKLSATGQDGQLRYTEVKLVCDKSVTSPILKRLGEPNNDWVYNYELTSKCACGNGCGGGGGGLSFGSILCILFSVLVVIYVVAGMLFMKFGRGAQGKEMIPNVKIWMDIPFLVKDGTLYIVSLVKPDGSSKNTTYDSI